MKKRLKGVLVILFCSMCLSMFSCNAPDGGGGSILGSGAVCEWAVGKWHDKFTSVELFTIYTDGYEMGGARFTFGKNGTEILTATENEFSAGMSSGGMTAAAFSLKREGDSYKYSLGSTGLYMDAVREVGSEEGGGGGSDGKTSLMDAASFMLAMSKEAFANVTADIMIPSVNGGVVAEGSCTEILYKATAEAEYMGGPVRIFLKSSGDAGNPYRYFHIGSGVYSSYNSNEWKNTASLSTALNGFDFLYENKPYRIFSKLVFSDFTDIGGGWYSYVDRQRKVYDSDDEIYEARLRFGSDRKLAEIKILYYECMEVMSNPLHEKGAIFASYIFSDYGSTRIDDLPKDGVVMYRLDIDDGGGTGGSDGLYYTPGGAGVEAGWYGDVSLKTKKTKVNIPSKSYTVTYDASNVEYTGSIPGATSRFDFAGYHIDGNVGVIDSQGSMKSEILQYFTLTEDVTAYADWENQTGITLPAPSATKTRTFVQWKNNGTPVSSPYYPTENTTLVAEWTSSLNPCKLTLNDNGGEGGSVELYYTKGNDFVPSGLYRDSFCTEFVSAAAIPEKYYLVSFSANNAEYAQQIEGLESHFGFLGYWLGDLCLIDSDGRVDSNKLKSLNLSSGVTLTAKWGSENGDVNVTDLENTQHHLFRGWKLNGSRVTGAYKPAGSVTLQGTWIDIYKLTLDDNGGSGGSGALYYTNGEGATAAGWYSDDALTISKSAVNKPVRNSVNISFNVNNAECVDVIPSKSVTFTFAGYNVNGQCKINSTGGIIDGFVLTENATALANYSNNGEVLPVLDMTDSKLFRCWTNYGKDVLDIFSVVKDVTLKADWVDIFRLTLDDKGGTGGSGTLYYTVGCGLVSAGWYSDNTLGTSVSSVSMPAKNSITVSFDVNNSKCTETIADKTLAFTFNGYKQLGSTKIGTTGSLAGFTIASNTTLTADWGGQSSITLPTLTDVIDFEFKGWKNGDTLLTDNTYTPDSSVTLKAVWKWLDNFVLVEGGSFTLGDGSRSDNSPVSVTLDSFYICDHEVTQGEYKAVMVTDPSTFSGDNLPVECVSWYDAVEYCNKLSELKGLDKCYSGSGNSIVCDWSKNGYRLPTEAEWEYAARGGKKSKGYKYSGSNTLGDVAWYNGNSSSRTHEVKTKSANELGLYDMSGNVQEWCWDRYKSSYSAGSNPHGAASDSLRVKRGGDWYYFAEYCEVSHRDDSDPGINRYNVGFRVVRSL